MKKIVFLDIDGVLNDHTTFDNGYCGIKPECVRSLNYILRAIPDLQIVLTSAWRYLVHSGSFNLEGLCYLFLISGLDCKGRIVGITPTDEETCGGEKGWEYLTEHGCRIRREQIRAYVETHGVEKFIVLDDLDLEMPELVQTDEGIGLTAVDAGRVIAMFAELHGLEAA
jgi:hypothetical protein